MSCALQSLGVGAESSGRKRSLLLGFLDWVPASGAYLVRGQCGSLAFIFASTRSSPPGHVSECADWASVLDETPGYGLQGPEHEIILYLVGLWNSALLVERDEPLLSRTASKRGQRMLLAFTPAENLLKLKRADLGAAFTIDTSIFMS